MNVAATFNKLKVVQFLADHGAPVDIASRSATPLYNAALFGYGDIVKFLLTRGARVHGDSSFEKIPLMIAMYEGFLGIVAELLARDANLQPELLATGDDTNATASPRTLLSHGQVLDLLIEHLKTDTSERFRTQVVVYNVWLQRVVRDLNELASELEAQWTPTVTLLKDLVLHAQCSYVSSPKV